MLNKITFFLVPFVILSSCISNEAYLKNKGNAFTLEVHTTPCFGTCPVYDLTVKESGLAVYNGRHFPDTGGEIFKKLPMSEVDSIRYVLSRNNFFELDSLYDDPMVMDLPSRAISLTLGNGTQKVVTGRYDQPQEFKNIAAFLERLRQRNFSTREK